jgi:copper transport protein
MAVWLGGLILLTRVVLAGPGDEDLVHAVRGFARISTPALWATVVTGAILLFRLDRGHLGSSHGLVLIVKTLMVSVMVFVGVAARQFISQRAARSDVMTAPLATRLRRALGIEALVGVVVLVLTAWLLALTPPGLAAGNGTSLALQPAHTFANPALAANVKVAFTERVGTNDVRIEVVTPPTGLTGLTVDFLPPVGTLVSGMTIDPIPLTGTGTAVLAKSTGFSLGASGTWTVVVRIGGQEVQRQDVFVGDGSPAPTSSTATTLAGA